MTDFNEILRQAGIEKIDFSYLPETFLGFNYDPKNGLIIKPDGKNYAQNEGVFELIKKSKQLSYNHIFFCDSNHTEFEKNQIFGKPEFIKAAKSNGYSIGVEMNQDIFRSYFGANFKDASTNFLFDKKLDFINDKKGFIAHNANSSKQSEVLYNIFYEAKQQNENLIFCDDGTKKELFLGYNSLKIKITEKIKKDYSDIDQENFKNALNFTGFAILKELRDQACENNIDKKDVIILRGAEHEKFSDDLDNTSNKSVTILNCNNENSLQDFIQLTFREVDNKYYCKEMFNLLKDKYPEFSDDLDKFKQISKIETNNKFEIPDFIMMNGQLYDAETYLKTHNIITNDKTIYDFLKDNNLLAEKHSEAIQKSRGRD